MTSCAHLNFHALCRVARLEDSGRFMLEARIACTDCGTPFQFLGLQPGMNMDGATVSLDGLEANLAICSAGHRPNPFQGLLGYSVEAVN